MSTRNKREGRYQHKHINPSPAYIMALDEAIQCNNQGLTLSRRGLFEEAEKYYLRALHLKLEHIGADTIAAALSRNALGELYISMNRLDEAEEHLEIAVRIRNSAGPTFDAAASRENLARVYEMRGDLKAAKQMRKSTGKFACGNELCPGQVFDKIELKQCAKCTAIYYCTQTCQKADWKRHKEYCHKLE